MKKRDREEVRQMRGVEISGSKGTYLELEDGRFADTVCNNGSDLKALRAEVTEYVDKPVSTTMSTTELAIYVGANR